ncbi:hypothetical protein [Paenibacillus periandrae]|uniref:hypothetical protein n=1 Tax=Paenibacillus periandrae TaxID=1761741 RepID=UPI001F08D9DB|nr:hypothetical protein [Paenibacillus periandrae]
MILKGLTSVKKLWIAIGIILVALLSFVSFAYLLPVKKTVPETRSVPYIHSLLIVRNGFLGLSTYFAPYQEGDGVFYQVHSVTKSITSALMGLPLMRVPSKAQITQNQRMGSKAP